VEVVRFVWPILREPLSIKFSGLWQKLILLELARILFILSILASQGCIENQKLLPNNLRTSECQLFR
jgi:hypothetical protein